MKKGFLYGAFSMVLFLSLLGCAKSARYSPDEMKDFPPDVQEKIRKGTVGLGMTIQQVRLAWGSPSEINVLQPTEDGRPREEWIYANFLNTYMERRILFIDGRVADIFPETR